MSEQSNISGEQETNLNSGLQEIPLNLENEKILNENMEVHHHPDLHHKRKHFKEYVLEFFMIFLAVTMGFFAESIREHFVELRNTRQYLETFKQELINNKRAFIIADSVYNSIVPSLDSVVRVFFEKRENQDLHIMSRLLRQAKHILIPSIDKAAYLQMVNSGGLKNLDNQALRDSISTYVGQIELFETYNSLIYSRRNNAITEIMKMEDAYAFSFWRFNPGYAPEIRPYQKMTEGERRLMIFYYTSNMLQFSSDIIQLERLTRSNDHLMTMIDEILDK